MSVDYEPTWYSMRIPSYYLHRRLTESDLHEIAVGMGAVIPYPLGEVRIIAKQDALTDTAIVKMRRKTPAEIESERLELAREEEKDRPRSFTTRQLELLAGGHCPYCQQKVRGWKAPVGAFAPEAWQTLRECGIDPATGHAANCRHKNLGI